MGLKQGGLRTSLRDVTTRVSIPDSVVHQYNFYNNFSQGSGTVVDSVGFAGMSLSGDFQDGSLGSESGATGDGTDDSGTASAETDWGRQDFGFAFTVKSPSIGSESVYFGLADSNFSNAIFVRSGVRSNNPGDIEFEYQVAGNAINASTDGTFDDGNAHAIIVNKIGDDPSNVEIYVDDATSAVATSVNLNASINYTNWSNPSADWGFWVQNFDGSLSRYLPATLGEIQLNTDPYDESQRQTFINNQPF